MSREMSRANPPHQRDFFAEVVLGGLLILAIVLFGLKAFLPTR